MDEVKLASDVAVLKSEMGGVKESLREVREEQREQAGTMRDIRSAVVTLASNMNGRPPSGNGASPEEREEKAVAGWISRKIVAPMLNKIGPYVLPAILAAGATWFASSRNGTPAPAIHLHTAEEMASFAAATVQAERRPTP